MNIFLKTFENERKYDKKYSTVSLDMTLFPKYNKIEVNTKTIILYKIGLEIIKFDKIKQIDDDGLDATWLGIETNRSLIIIGSVYHSPSYKCTYDAVEYQLNQIKRITKCYKNRITILAGDYNAKHALWGSSCTDQRGIELNDWMCCNKLSFCNNGSSTCGTKKKGDVLDLTMISQDNINVVKEWSVQDIPTKRRDKDGVKIRFSDHRGIVMILNADPKIRSKPTRVTWNLDPKKVQLFNDALEPKIEKWKDVYYQLYHEKENVELLVEYFQKIIVETARETFGFKKISENSVNWVDKKCINY